MDAMVEGVPVTPRHGFPIDVNALYIHALGILIDHSQIIQVGYDLHTLYKKSMEFFSKTFVTSREGYLADGFFNGEDLSLRPNCLWALALSRVPVDAKIATSTLQAVKAKLLTPVGLRTLSPDDSRYKGKYFGDQKSRDYAYHQGTVWPWLLGVYCDAIIKWQGKKAASEIFVPVLDRMKQHLFEEGCVGHVSEIFDGDSPHKAGGSPVQAWSSCELLRLIQELK
jgi:predicted glycogen debranching enzyme